MEATKEGQLVRQHHPGPNWRISRIEDVRYRIQRLGKREQPRVFICPSQVVSKSHCEFFRRGGAYWIKDLDSTNGTYLNGNKIQPNCERELRFDDIIGIGVSHIEDDSSIPVADARCFIYKFKPITADIVDVDDDDDDIQIVDEFESPTKLASHGAGAPGSSSKLPMGPPPVPPAPISKSKTSTPTGQSTVVDRGMESDATFTNGDSGPRRSIPREDISTASKTKSKHKMPFTDTGSVKSASSDDHNQGPKPKRAKRMATSSSDDSSDGLGDPTFTSKMTSSSNASKTRAVSRAPDGSSSDDEDVFNSNTSAARPKPGSKTSASKANVDVPVTTKPKLTARKSTCPSPKLKSNEVKVKKVPKKEATLKLHHIIKRRKDGNFSMAKEIKRLLNPSIAKRVQRQFLASVFRNENAKSSHGTLEPGRGFGTPQDSEMENITPQKHKVLPLNSSSESDDEHEPTSPAVPFSKPEETPRPQHWDRSPSPPVSISDGELPSEDEHNEAFHASKNEAQLESGKVGSSSAPVGKSHSYRLQLIEDAPPPRDAIRAQIRGKVAAAALKTSNPSTSFSKNVYSRSNSNDASKRPIGTTQYMSKDEHKQLRNQKLKEVEMKRQQERQDNVMESAKKPKPATNVKVRFTARNRNQGLMEDIVGKDILDTESVIGGVRTDIDPARAHANYASYSGAALRLGEPDPRLKRKMEEGINTSMNMNEPPPPQPQPSTSKAGQRPVFPTPTERPKAMPPPAPPFLIEARPQPAQKEQRRYNLKQGAEVILSPPPVGIPISFGGKASNGNTNGPSPSTKMSLKPYKPEYEIYKRICEWRPAWIEEQKKMKEEPPVVGVDYSVTMTLTSYANFQEYFNTYYPLLLFEIWSSISSDNGKGKHNEGAYGNHRAEYPVKIDEITRPGYCRLLKQSPMGRADRSPPDDSWVCITYHTWARHEGEVDIKRNFVALTVQGTEKTTNREIKDKTVFGITLFNSEKYDMVDMKRGNCDERLLQKSDSTRKGSGYRYSETVVFKFGSKFVVDTNVIGQLRRVYYIGSKIKEFRALNELQSMKLYKHIVSPPEIKRPWKVPDVNGKLDPHNLISICRHLNPDQRSMIDHVTKRVFSDEPELMLMHGPPGTGKTETIVALVLNILDACIKKDPKYENRRILICTPSNAAIDEIMRRLIDFKNRLPAGKTVELLRIGDNYAKTSEPYSLAAKVRAKNEETANRKSLNVELTAVENEIELANNELTDLKNRKANPIQIAAKSSSLRELEAKKIQLENDLNYSGKRKDSKHNDEKKRDDIIKDAHVICSTLSSSGNSRMKNAFAKSLQFGEKPFLCCIIDEASQTTEPETLLPLVYNVDKLLLVGDPHQLGATVRSAIAETKGYGQSMFSRLYKFYSRKPSNPVMMLRRQYRMHPDIVKWPNSYCYEDKLQTVYQPPPNCRYSFPLRPYYFLNMSSGAGREHSEKEGQIENADEMEMVKALLDTLEEILVLTKTELSVGIITPYAAQKATLTKEVTKKSFRRLQRIQVDTVDGFQGQEKDIIILSCVRTDGTGFLKSKNRLNVALTRAKHCLYIIGDGNNLSQDDMWQCLIKDAAARNCKYDVKPNFRLNLAVLKGELTVKLKSAIRQ